MTESLSYTEIHKPDSNSKSFCLLSPVEDISEQMRRQRGDEEMTPEYIRDKVQQLRSEPLEVSEMPTYTQAKLSQVSSNGDYGFVEIPIGENSKQRVFVHITDVETSQETLTIGMSLYIRPSKVYRSEKGYRVLNALDESIYRKKINDIRELNERRRIKRDEKIKVWNYFDRHKEDIFYEVEMNPSDLLSGGNIGLCCINSKRMHSSPKNGYIFCYPSG